MNGTVLEALRRVGTLRPSALWPGFDPATIPVALYDGTQTVLARFPRLPDGFRSVSGGEEITRMEGRHPAVTASTAIEIDDVAVAAVMIAATAPPPVDALTGLIVHEAFHVHQRQRYPS